MAKGYNPAKHDAALAKLAEVAKMLDQAGALALSATGDAEEAGLDTRNLRPLVLQLAGIANTLRSKGFAPKA